MTDPIAPIRRTPKTRRQRRRADDPPPHDADEGRQALIVISPPRDERPRPSGGRAGVSAFLTQLMTQDSRRRGLREGLPVLTEARSTYLGTEFSGPADRRPRAGKVIKTEI
jgi:hypothetical protein